MTKMWDYNKVTRRPVWKKVLVPIVLTAIAIFIKVYFFSENVQKAPYLLFLGVVLLCASYGGSRSALIATIITFFSALVLLFLPSFPSAKNVQINVLQLFVFSMEALMITGLIRQVQIVQKALKLKEKRFRGIVEKTEEGFFMVDESLTIFYHTPTIKFLLGYADEDLRLKDLYDLIHPDDMDEFKLAIMKLLADQVDFKNKQFRIKTQLGDWIWVELNISNLLKDESIKALVVHLNNISEKINKEKQQEDFINIATHELKSPVTVLKGYLQIISTRLKKTENSEEYLKMLDKMDIQLNKLLTLISDMLDSTGIRSGELNHHFAYFNLNTCIRECADAVKASQDCKIECHLEPDPFIVGDKERIGQVLNNFMTNALKYSPNNKNIIIKTERDGNYIKIKVIDYGIGIPKDKQKQIFDRFYRVDTLPKGVFEGLGLGLFICAEIIKKHNGEIGVFSEEGKGSEFWFSLPV